MRIKVDRRSGAYKRITSAGFKIANINIKKRYISNFLYYTPIIRFKCVCGRLETATDFAYYSRTQLPKKLDIAQMLEDIGSVSIEHLQDDGYTEEEIKHIRRSYA